MVIGGTSQAGLAGTPHKVFGETAKFVLRRRSRHSHRSGVSPQLPDGSVRRRLLAQANIYNRQAQADYGIEQLSLRQQQLSTQKDLNQVQVDVTNAVIALEQSRARYDAGKC